jgi:hypothetical protein
MSSVASSNNGSTTGSATPSTAASTTGSAGSGASTAASAASAASAPSTAPSTANQATSAPGSAGAAPTQSLEEWYNAKKKSKQYPSIGEFVRNPRNTTIHTPPAEFNDFNSLMARKNVADGVYLINGEKVTVVDMSKAGPDGKYGGEKSFTVDGTTTKFTWKDAAPGDGTHFDFTNGDGSPTASTGAKSVGPSLTPFLQIIQPAEPEKPEWLKTWDRKTAQPAQDLDLCEWPIGYKTIESHKEETEYDPRWGTQFDRCGKVILDAIRAYLYPCRYNSLMSDRDIFCR